MGRPKDTESAAATYPTSPRLLRVPLGGTPSCSLGPTQARHQREQQRKSCHPTLATAATHGRWITYCTGACCPWDPVSAGVLPPAAALHSATSLVPRSRQTAARNRGRLGLVDGSAPLRYRQSERQSRSRAHARSGRIPGAKRAVGSRPRSAVNSCGCRQGDGVGSLKSCKAIEGGLRRETYRTAVGGD